MIINNAEIKDKAISANLTRLISQVYKLLPGREEGLDWKTPLETIIEEFLGMNILLEDYHDILFSLICKLKGLLVLTEDTDFVLYRRTIFDCLNLISNIKDHINEKEGN